MLRYLCLIVPLLLPGAIADAKPLLLDSQETYGSTCIDFHDTYLRLVEICERALDEPGGSRSQRVEVLNALGNALMELEHYDRSETAFRQALELHPQSTMALRGLGWVFEGQGNCAEAAPFFEQANRIRPSAPGLFGAALCRNDLGELGFDDMLLQMEVGLSLDPDYTWGMRKKGWMLLDADRYEEAADMFAEAIGVDDRDTIARRGLAATYRNMDDFDRALEEINKALAIDPDGAYLLSERSLILFYLDRNKKAADDAQRVIDALPDYATGYVRKARALAELGRRGEALDLMDEAYERLGTGGFLSYWYARLLYDDEQYGASVSVLKRLAETGEADQYDFGLLARAQLARDHVDGAREAVDRVLEIDPDYKWGIFYDSLVLIESGAFDAAVDRFDDALEAGLHWSNYQTFNEHLVANGQFMKAIEMRVRYNDWKKAQRQDN